MTERTSGRRPVAEEGEGIEDEAVDGLPHDGRADGAGPEAAALGPDLHLREHVAVAELAAEVGHQRGEHDARGGAEDRLVGGLVGPALGGREGEDDRAHDRGEDEGAEAGPDHPAGPRVAVHLGEHVAEDVADGEEEHPRAELEAAELRHLGGADHVRAEQHGHEGRHHELVVLVRCGAWARRSGLRSRGLGGRRRGFVVGAAGFEPATSTV